ncbi:MAG: HNH endonuclease [Deltaproteobacteria bacterium]|nr:HNH endonuclease [Deltaproteobacteria bacterium]
MLPCTAFSLQSTPDKALLLHLESLRGNESFTVADIVRYLAEVLARGIFRDLGYPSLFTFCVERLGYSRGSAYRRCEAARILGAHPEIYELIKGGKLQLCTVAEISKVVDEKKRGELLKAAVGKSREEAAVLVARELPARSTGSDFIDAKGVEAGSNKMVYRFSVELDEECMRLYGVAKEIVGHLPAKEVLRRVLKEFIGRRKEVKRMVKESLEGSGRYIPKSVRVEVGRRDGGQCTFVAEDGKRCTERHGLEIDHVMPYGLGGGNERENLRLLCRAHNRLMAERVFGREKIRAVGG